MTEAEKRAWAAAALDNRWEPPAPGRETPTGAGTQTQLVVSIVRQTKQSRPALNWCRCSEDRGMTEQERAAALADGMEYDVHIGRYPRDETHDLIVAALRAYAAPTAPTLPPIEREGSREYIPLPGGWEIQTKGDGSSYRLCDTKTGERLNILGGDGPTAQDFVTRMAKAVHAASLPVATPAAPSVVTDEVIERVAKAMAIADGSKDPDALFAPPQTMNSPRDPYPAWMEWLGQVKAALSAIRPGDRLPAGVVVPEEPTEEMVVAAEKHPLMSDAIRAAIAAAKEQVR